VSSHSPANVKFGPFRAFRSALERTFLFIRLESKEESLRGCPSFINSDGFKRAVNLSPAHSAAAAAVAAAASLARRDLMAG